MSITWEDIKDREITVEEIPPQIRLMFEDLRGRETDAADFYRRGLCWEAVAEGEEEVRRCGEPAEPRSRLGHCMMHYRESGD